MRFFRSTFPLAAFLISGAAVRAQVVEINQSFTNSTAPGWVFGGSGYTPTLTAAAGGPDTAGNGWLRMTTAGQNEATYAYDATPFASANATITAQFNYASYGGTGADGITFFLADASQPFAVGAYGGSLGYAQKTAAGGATNINGMAGGYLGLGIDEFGNYSNPTEGRIGGPGFIPDAIAVRGPGSGLAGYNYLGGTTALSQPIAYPSQTTRPSGSEAETIQIVLTSTNQLTVSIEFGTTGVFNAIFTADLSAYTRPDNLIMGFTAGTGSNTDIHEIQNVLLSSIPANLWTNLGGTSTWTNASNWYGSPSVVPTTGSDVLLNDKYVSTAQSIAVSGTQVIRSLQIDAPFSYSLTGGGIEFNNEGVVGPSGIIITDSNGTANMSIGSALQADNAINIQNNSGGSLTLTGTLNTNGNAVQFNGSGVVTESGVVSGAGSILQSGTGNTTLSAANTYTGGTTISAGTLTANNNSALGTGGVTLNGGGTLASTTNASVANTISLTGNGGLSGLTTTGVLTQTGSDTLIMSGATQSGNVALAATGSATQQKLTVEVDSGTSTISGVISNGGTAANSLGKTGTGTLIVSGANTYTGGTTLSAGTLDANNNSALGTGTVNLGGGTLGSTTSAVVSNALTLTASSGLSGITTSGTLTETGSNTLVMANASQTGGVVLSTAGSQTMTVEVDSGTSTISGVISNGSAASGIDKTGTGNLIIGSTSSVDTYTGTTKIDQGTLSLGGNNVINSASAVNINGGTLNLAGYSDKVGNLSFSDGTLDYGTAGGNTFVFNTISSATGVLNVANFKTGDAMGATTSAIATTLLNQLYFAGSGSGAVEATSTSTVGSEGTAYLINPNTTFLTWNGNGANTNWTTANNWVGSPTPAPPSTTAGSVQKIDFTGANTTSTMNGNYSANAIKFDSGASNFTINTSGKTLTMDGVVPSIIQQSASNETISGAGSLVFAPSTTGGIGVIDVSGAGNLTIASNISGSGNITKLSAGTLILSGSNSGFTGGMDISGGTVQTNTANGLGTGNVKVETGATLAVAAPAASTVANTITLNGTGIGGAGALTNTNNATLSGAITLGSNATIATTGTLAITGGISGSGNTLTVNGTGNTTISSAITTGTGGVTINNTGTTTLSGANTYTGVTTVNAGTLSLGGTGTDVNGDLVVNSATVTDTVGGKIGTNSNVTLNAATLNLNGTTGDTVASLAGTTGSTVNLNATTLKISGSTSTTYAGVITGSGTLDKAGTGTLALTGSNTGYTGPSTVEGGTLAVSGNPNALGTGAITVKTTGNLQVSGNIAMTNALNLSSSASAGAVENISGNNTLSGAVTVSGATRLQSDSGVLTLSGGIALGTNALDVGGASNTNFTGAMTGSGALTKDGNGTLELDTANASYTGAVTITAGSLEMDSLGALTGANAVTDTTGAVLNLNDYNETLKSINGGGAINFGSTTNEVLTLTGGTSLLTGSFSGYGTIVVGAGETLTLGTAFNSPNINIVMNGGTLNLDGFNDTFGTVSVTANSTIDFGSGTSSDLNATTVTVGTGDTLNVTNWTNGADYFYATNQPTAATLSQITFSGTTNPTHWETYTDGPDNNHQITPAPEPSTYGAIFVGVSLAGLVYLRRRRATAAA